MRTSGEQAERILLGPQQSTDVGNPKLAYMPSSDSLSCISLSTQQSLVIKRTACSTAWQRLPGFAGVLSSYTAAVFVMVFHAVKGLKVGFGVLSLEQIELKLTNGIPVEPFVTPL